MITVLNQRCIFYKLVVIIIDWRMHFILLKNETRTISDMPKKLKSIFDLFISDVKETVGVLKS
jgi:hypothetical protein